MLWDPGVLPSLLTSVSGSLVAKPGGQRWVFLSIYPPTPAVSEGWPSDKEIRPWGTETAADPEGLQDRETSITEAINLGPPTSSGPSTQPLKEKEPLRVRKPPTQLLSASGVPS